MPRKIAWGQSTVKRRKIETLAGEQRKCWTDLDGSTVIGIAQKRIVGPNFAVYSILCDDGKIHLVRI